MTISAKITDPDVFLKIFNPDDKEDQDIAAMAQFIYNELQGHDHFGTMSLWQVQVALCSVSSMVHCSMLEPTQDEQLLALFDKTLRHFREAISFEQTEPVKH